MDATSNELFCSSQFLSLQKGKLKWNGSLQILQSFFSAFLTSLRRDNHTEASAQGLWKNVPQAGNPVQGTFSDFVCTLFRTTSTLQVQGKNASFIVFELKKIVKQPMKFGVYVVPIEESPKSSKEKQEKIEQTLGKTALIKEQNEPAKEQNVLTAEHISNGMVPGKYIKLVIASKLREWVKNCLTIIVVTPFIDPEGLTFLVESIQGTAAKTKIEIYVRKDCHWDCDIEQVIIQSKFSKHWIVQCINAVKTVNKKPPFHAKFLAGVSGEDNPVDLVLTSSNITKDHLESNQLETLERKTLSFQCFSTFWMKPLLSMCQERLLEFIDIDELSSRFEQL